MENDKKIVIMAGGEGFRLYPFSTSQKPKQFLSFIGKKTLLQQAYERALLVTAESNIFITTLNQFVPFVVEQIPVKIDNIIAEPFKKNTAISIAFATKYISDLCSGSCGIAFIPSDSYVNNDEFFLNLNIAFDVAKKYPYLVTIGIEPTSVSTQYGYINPENCGIEFCDVKDFVEKPNELMAKKYIEDGYLWNSGIFIWSPVVFLNSLSTYANDIYKNIFSGKSKNVIFNSSQSISIDYALMEKSKNVVVIKTDMDWSDLGTWQTLKTWDNNQNFPALNEKVIDCSKNIIDKPWGHEEIWANNDGYVGKTLFIKKNQSLSLQYHRYKSETMRLLFGKVKLFKNGQETTMEVNNVVYIPPYNIHRIIALEDSVVLEVSTDQLKDIVRLEDDYGR